MSAKQTSSRLQFLRIAFGSGGGLTAGNSIATHELHSLFNNYIEGGRLSVVWNAPDILVDLAAGKLLLNLCLIASETLPRGGVVEVNISELDGHLGFGVAAIGEKALLPPEFRTIMRQAVDMENLTAKNVHGHFTTVLAAQLGAELEVSPDVEGEVRLAALLPRA
jgi:histidine phosphotransferase ChpT